MNLYVDYNSTLVEMGMNLIVLASELESPSFLVLMSLKVPYGEPKSQGVKQPPSCILDSLNKFSEVLTYELPDALPPYKEIDHKIKMVLGVALPSKAPCRLN